MRRVAALAAALLAVLVACATASAAQQARLSEVGNAKFPDRSFVLTLPESAQVNAENIRVRENGKIVDGVTVTPGSQIGQKQFGTVLVIDASSSMKGSAIQGAMAAARAFARQRNPQQPLAVVVFNNEAKTILPLTTDADAIKRALATPPPLARETHIYDATSSALQLLDRAKVQAGTVIVLSDGSDTGSRATERTVAAAAKSTPGRIYTVGLRTRAYSPKTLTGLAAATGGVHTEATAGPRLESIYRDLGQALSNQYILRYRSMEPLGTKVDVAARVKGQRGVARAGYTTAAIKGTPASELDNNSDNFVDTTAGALTISVLCAFLIALAILAVTAPRRSVRSRVERFVSPPAADDERAWSGALLERVFGEGDANRRDRAGFWADFSRQLELARVNMSPEGVVFWTLAASIVLGWLLASATGAPAAGLMALVIPVGVWMLIVGQVQRQQRMFDEQLPDNLQVIASAMRAGHTFVSALAVVLEDTAEPSRREFRRVLTDEQLGIPLQTALRGVAERMNSRDFERVALVVTLQRETGGNTAEVMDRLTETIRERMELRRIIRTLTAQGRLTRWIVTALPILMLIFISLVNPDYIRPLFHTATGILFLVMGTFMLIVGSLIIKRIVEFEE